MLTCITANLCLFLHEQDGFLCVRAHARSVSRVTCCDVTEEMVRSFVTRCSLQKHDRDWYLGNLPVLKYFMTPTWAV